MERREKVKAFIKNILQEKNRNLRTDKYTTYLLGNERGPFHVIYRDMDVTKEPEHFEFSIEFSDCKEVKNRLVINLMNYAKVFLWAKAKRKK
jgi:hypothetical protein